MTGLRPAPLPASVVQKMVELLRMYLSTADAGPRGKKGVPHLWVIDAKARKVLAEVDALRKADAV